MKIEREETIGYKPVKFSVTLETQEEYDSLISLVGINETAADYTTKNRMFTEERRAYSEDTLKNILGEIYEAISQQN